MPAFKSIFIYVFYNNLGCSEIANYMWLIIIMNFTWIIISLNNRLWLIILLIFVHFYDKATYEYSFYLNFHQLDFNSLNIIRRKLEDHKTESICFIHNFSLFFCFGICSNK